MNVGDEQYRKHLKRWHSLSLLTRPTPRQQKELACVEAALSDAEMRHEVNAALRTSVPFEMLVDDADVLALIRDAGNLGPVEL
jgi:hypothetical protein